jgi:hypothetical protein
VLRLPAGVVIDFSPLPAAPSSPRPPPRSKVPVRSTDQGPVQEIVFAPSGAVIGQGASNPGFYYLWVRDNGADTQRRLSSNALAGNPRLIVVHPRTGFIASHPVASGSDPYAFLRDGLSSGM